MRFLILFTTLMAGWLLMSGIYNGLLIGFGIASCLLCSWLSLRIGATDREGLPTHLFVRLPAYLVWLIGEIIVSNIATAKIILRGTSDPEIFEVSANQATAAGLANYANSITLTPGTVPLILTKPKKAQAGFWFTRFIRNLAMMCEAAIWISVIAPLRRQCLDVWENLVNDDDCCNYRLCGLPYNGACPNRTWPNRV